MTPTREQMDAAIAAMNDRGFDFRAPWECVGSSISDGGVESRHALSQTSPTTQQFEDSRGPRGIHQAGIASGPSENTYSLTSSKENA